MLDTVVTLPLTAYLYCISLLHSYCISLLDRRALPSCHPDLTCISLLDRRALPSCHPDLYCISLLHYECISEERRADWTSLLGVILLSSCSGYPYCISSLPILFAYLYCIYLLHIFAAYLYDILIAHLYCISLVHIFVA